ncbi:MAG: glycosyltransferase family 4 protein [Candidatus Methanomethylicaceae archaeon]
MTQQEFEGGDFSDKKLWQLGKVSKTVLMMSTLPIWPIGPEHSTPVLYHTLNAFLKAGWSIYFVAGFEPKFEDKTVTQQIHIAWFGSPLIRKLRLIGDTVRGLGFFARLIWWLIAQIQLSVKGFHLIEGRKIDLIYSWDVIAAPAAWFLSRKFKVPWVARYLGTWVPLPKKNKFLKLLWEFRFWQEALAFKLPADLLIMTNDGTRGNEILREFGVDMQKVRFWVNGLDWRLFIRLPTSQEAKESLNLSCKNIILSVGRLVRWKRFERVIYGIQGVIEEFPEVLLVIVGDGPDRERLERLTSELKIQHHVRFEGAVPRTEIPKYMAAADIFITLYDWSNVGNTLLEAMMAGKCIVTLNSGDTGQFIRNGENGILLDYEDLPKLPEIIKMLLTDPSLRNQLGSNTRRFAEEHFWSWEERLNAEMLEIQRLLH